MKKQYHVAFHYLKRGLFRNVTGFGSCISVTESDFVFTQTGMLAIAKSIGKDYKLESVVIINIIPLED